MAKLNEQKITFKLSQLLRDSDSAEAIISDENMALLIQALESMLEGKHVLIELEDHS